MQSLVEKESGVSIFKMIRGESWSFWTQLDDGLSDFARLCTWRMMPARGRRPISAAEDGRIFLVIPRPCARSCLLERMTSCEPLLMSTKGHR